MFENKEAFKKEFQIRLIEKYGRDIKGCDITECYDILGSMVRDAATINAKECKDEVIESGNKQLIYFSMEFLIGRLLSNNMINLGIYNVVKEGLADLGLDLEKLEDQEADAGLGNGGLGRLAACFMDSIASLGLAGHGNCIRYDYGFFRQKIKNGHQEELPDQWLVNGNVWEIRKPKHAVTVNFYGNAETYYENGEYKRRTVNALKVLAIPCDVSIIGYDNKVTNTLRLWTAEPADEDIPQGESFTEYLNFVRNITHGLYPDDTTENGKLLRLRQQYFLVSAGLQSALRAHYRKYKTYDNLPDHYVFQLNDTHPIMAIPELMRLLMDEHDYGWDKAYEIATKCFAFTNHTVMAEALEKWPCHYIANLCPRVYMIIEEINRRTLISMREKHLPQSVIDNSVIIKDGMVRMCQLAIHVAFSVNGVAKLHTDILKADTFKDLYSIYPWKFNNKTNGITHRRWFLAANRELSDYVTSLIGDSWIMNPDDLEKLGKYVDDKDVLNKVNEIKKHNKKALIDLIKKENNIDVDENSIFDVQIKRLHAYKRQLMNIFRIIHYYQQIKTNKDFKMYPHTFIFGAKAAPSYVYAKKIIELILAVANKVNNDPEVNKFMKVVFIENYGVSKAEVIIPAADISEQISTAGKEASGTSNMKFMINGAVTLGTLDGANVEIAKLVGDENAVIFGLHEDEINKIRFENSYNPFDVYNSSSDVKKVMDSLLDGTFDQNRDRFRMIFDEIMYRGDEYFILKDFDSYLKASKKTEELYLDRSRWAKMCLVNVSKAGYFSSDRTIKQYNDEIWHLEPIKR
ncbi:MAG: glycogen/starch/alpha-glucan phosphorylase [Bacilli bacterium]|nr:glycogen/starch/alpha-glucan phosphorylase [Bacilli bacterium]MDD7549589.1 glycogen/starch/alpha-glucan phosphorylase [Bacilli bacterium]MDD7598034.1 glycogen/starch/alpha-glucan phosphorylase [Bacilli bacterium]MDY4723724.1 glycogen/starch/alpha-glucan phosphorylase [Bacilli bacterium]MDY5745022.1 glycogen/starch/alpha-glucan phosphorylase [Bacilli bacterium]